MRVTLWQQVLLGLVLGSIVGLVFKEQAADLKVLGTIFINLIKMVMIPVLFFALITGITSVGQGSGFKRLGIKATAAYLCTSAFAVVIGLSAASLLQPGKGVDLSHVTAAGSVPLMTTAAPTLSKTLMDIVPHNAIGAMAEANVLHVIIFAIFTGALMNVYRTHCAQLIQLCHQTSFITFKMIEVVVKISPIGVFGFIASTVGTQGVDTLLALLKLVETVIVACLVQYVMFGLLLLLGARISPFPFFRKMRTTQMLAFCTSSSKATLSTAMQELHQKMGVSRQSTNFVLPLGAAINMDGTAIYLGICALFFAQALGHPLSPHDYGMVILTSTLASIGAAGIPSGSLIFMGMVLTSIGLPLEGIALIAGVDRILDMLRTTINITGDATITLFIDKTEGYTDMDRYYAKERDIAILQAPQLGEREQEKIMSENSR